ncbi:hypothetical protein MHU86_23808 [Fragilaria crotonensis]|nr:hypothetical protein MHU86_23808 [Fragilaria crotonensis]
MTVNGAGTSNRRGMTATRAETAVIDGVDHRRLVLPTARQEIQNSLTRSALVPHGTPRERPSSVRPQPLTDDSHVDADDGSTHEPPRRRQRQVLQRCCDCSRSSTCALSRPTARSQACPCRVANKRCTSCSCFNNCQNKRAPLPTPITATLRCFFASPSNTATTAPTPAIDPAPPAAAPTATEIPPALSLTSRHPSASTSDVAGDIGMTPEPLDRAPPPSPDDDNDDPSQPATTAPETAANAGEDPIPACPPVTVAAANRANATAREAPEAAPGPALTPDAGGRSARLLRNRGGSPSGFRLRRPRPRQRRDASPRRLLR